MPDNLTDPMDEKPLNTSSAITSESLSVRPRGKKLFVIGGSIAAVLIVLGFGSWAAYALWYQSPDKVVSDALANALTAKTMMVTGTASGDDEKGNHNSFTYSTKASYAEGASLSLQFKQKVVNTTKEIIVDTDSVVTPIGDSYTKIDNLQALSTQLRDGMIDMTTGDAAIKQQMAELYGSFLDSIIAGIDSKWIKLTTHDIKQLDAKTGEEYECVQTTLKGVATNSDLMQEIGGRYRDNKFIKIEKSLGTENGKMGYIIKIDSATAQKFLTSLKSTKLYKELGACSPKGDNPLDRDVKDFNGTLDNARIELWVDQWTHQIASLRLEFSGKKKSDLDNYTFDMTTQFNTPVKIEVPAEAVPLGDAIPGLGQLFGGESQESATSKLFSDMI